MAQEKRVSCSTSAQSADSRRAATRPRVALRAPPLWAAAAWYERETHDLFGVVFQGNDDLEPLLLYEGFEGHPGLKSFPLNDYDEY